MRWKKASVFAVYCLERREAHGCQCSGEKRLEKWIARYGDAVLRVCYLTLLDAPRAEDAAQETFLRAWRFMDRCEAGRQDVAYAHRAQRPAATFAAAVAQAWT